MLDKVLKMLRGGEKTATPTPEEPSAASPLDELIPLLDTPPRPPRASGESVDTGRAQGVVSDVLPVDTHGRRTQLPDLLQRFLGRTPVLDASGQVFGYELRLKKSVPATGAGAITLRQMVDEMLLASLLDLDIHKLRAGRLIFAGISVHTLDSGFLERLGGNGLVLALAPEGDPHAVATRLAELKGMGYRIALDEPRLTPELRPLLAQADYIRVDVTARDAIRLGEFAVAALEKTRAELVALQVDAEESVDVCRKLGFKAFQGYGFTRLSPGKPHRLTAQRLRLMELLNKVLARAEFAEIEAVFKRDPTLSYRLLRYINCAANGLLQPVRSLSHALMVLGYDQLYRWLTLLLFASGEPDFRTRALMRTALVRGRFAELLGRDRLPAAADALFITGMFSLLDALLNLPLPEAIASLKLPAEIVQALLKREGPYAPYLELVLATEEGEERILETYAAVCGISAVELNAAHAQALAWAEEVDQAS